MALCLTTAGLAAGCDDSDSSEDGAADDTGSADGGDGDGGDEGDNTIPANEYCADVDNWDPAWVQFEAEVLDIANQRRAEGADCGSEGTFGSAEPLVVHGALTCAARVHAQDMVDRGYFDHTGQDGSSPWDRMERAGYSWRNAGENIAQGYPDPEAVMQGWMDSDGHCSNIMNPSLRELGVGYVGGSNMWVQVFGTR